ncbi:hypothetical protein BLA29_003026 [Euroglyphus maynei]|uniref:Uncharacterized protein n=1 Tax=Euroglyphus maynei TaxID=6958 RepID=A0A1Y3BAA3_EURMA|nr:hypothetical protein BLA29_003026 [Euroglyphus maynei]
MTSKEEPPNYIELDFSNRHQLPNTINRDQPEIPVVSISPPPRLSRYEQQKQRIDKYFVQNSVDQQHSTSVAPRLSNTDPLTNLKTNRTHQHEDPRELATFLCKLNSVEHKKFGIFASVMTTVLVLMFYIVGEAAFRLMLMVISFVSILTLCLACFFRRPTLIIVGQNTAVQESSNNLNQKYYTTPQPCLLIFPTLYNRNHSSQQNSC